MANTPTNLPKFFNETEVAASLGRSKRCLQGWRLRGEGPPYVKLGTGIRSRVAYSASDLAAWLESQRRTFTGERRDA